MTSAEPFTGTSISDFVSELRFPVPSARRKDPSLPRISVVMPSFNQGRFIRRSILSILNQNYGNLELIVIDGGSEDGTIDVLRELDQYVDIWTSEPDTGQSNALNKGFQKATGDIFAWQNADDLYLSGTFPAVCAAFSGAPDAGIVYGDWLLIDEHDEVLDRNFALPVRVPHTPYDNMKAYNQSLFWRRAVHKRFGAFDEALNRLMDNDMVIRFIRNEGVPAFLRLPAFLGAFRSQGQQKTRLDAIDEVRKREELHLERKFKFPPARSFGGIYFRFSYRLFQLYHTVKRGGIPHAARKAVLGIQQRKGWL